MTAPPARESEATGIRGAVGRRLPCALTRPRGGLPLLVVLLAADIAVAVVHLTTTDWFLSLENDEGLGGRLGQLQLLAVAVLVGATYAASREPVHLAWAAGFLVAVADDTLKVHEWAGLRVADATDREVLGLRPDDLGELAAWAVIAGGVLLLVVAGHLRSSPRARAESWGFVVLVAALAFFGIAVDMLHIVIDPADRLVGAVEDGGELVVSSVLIVYAWAVLASWRTTPPQPDGAPVTAAPPAPAATRS